MTSAQPTPALPSLAALLAQHGLDGIAEQSFPHTGFSGATLTRLVRTDGASFVLKRMSIDRDWIMRATDDGECREAVIAAAHLTLARSIRTPSLGAACDGNQFAVLMRDISAQLLPPGEITALQLAQIVDGMAMLHRTPPPQPPLPYCDAAKRLTLLTPRTARIAAAYGVPVARDLLAGWALFERHASPRALEIIRALTHDPSPLLRALNQLPSAFLHGDLKLDNIGLDPGGQMWLIDWAMTLVAPPAVELGWFLAINSDRITASLDEVTQRYAEAVQIVAKDRARHDGLTVLCGLLLRGWRKALDTEAGDPGELRWWCERAEAGAKFLE